jgi:hypothetical protein
LAQLLTEGLSTHPRWLVKFDGQAYNDEEMYERAFGKLLYSAVIVDEGEEGSFGGDNPTSSGRKRSSKGGTTISEVSSEGEKSDVAATTAVDRSTISKKTNNDKKSVQFSNEVEVDDAVGGGGDATDGGGSSPMEDHEKRPAINRTLSRSDGRKSKASDREQRSRRRHAKIDEESFIMIPGMELLGGGKRKINPNSGSTALKKYKHDPTLDGEVVTVQLLTGTLHLYRGVQRRVEFVRRV